ncbi:hypothetical protein [Nonomuraea sp. NPDC001831]|uniref:hypothetical protein n=1 Tax=Nonomuraea sp. NPDC001831 TaxID=3364340 RepID=UPI0036AE14D9
MQRRLGERRGAGEGARPQAVEDRPRLAEPLGVVGAHPGAFGHAAVQLGLDEGRDVHAVHHDVPQLAADLDVDELGAAQPHAGQVGRAHADVEQAYPGERAPPHAHVLDLEVFPVVGHDATR